MSGRLGNRNAAAPVLNAGINPRRMTTMRTHMTLMAAAVALALGFTCEANADEKASSVDAKARAITEASVREQAALELRGARLGGSSRAGFDSLAAVEGELESAIDAELESETEAEAQVEAEAQIEADVELEVDAEIESAVADEVEAAVDAVVEQAVEAEVEAAVAADVESAVDAAVESEVESQIESEVTALIRGR